MTPVEKRKTKKKESKKKKEKDGVCSVSKVESKKIVPNSFHSQSIPAGLSSQTNALKLAKECFFHIKSGCISQLFLYYALV